VVRNISYVALAVLMTVITAGCGQTASNDSPQSISVDKTKYLLTEEPEGAVGVIMARKQAKDQDEIVLVGRIGGKKDPWFKDRAAFVMIDASMMLVADGTDATAGEICLDDCCASLLAGCTTLVKVVDENGTVLPINAQSLLDAGENDMIVVRGRVQRKDKDSFSVIANGVYVRR
jgi:hypothetical protein